MKSINIHLTVAGFALVLCTLSCDLLEGPISQADKKMVFSTESSVESYAVSFYQDLPSLADLVYYEDGKADYLVTYTYSNYYIDGAYDAEKAGTWGWSSLRNINYFIDGINDKVCKLSDESKAHYLGLARFFRAYFYYEKLVRFGDCPWFEHCLNADDLDEIYKDRDSRDLIIDKIIEDLDYAAEHIRTTESVDNSLVTPYAALLLKSRACLFEGTFRKYHALSSPDWKYDDKALLTLAASAAEKLMNSKVFSLNTSAGDKGAYRDLFVSERIKTNEVILGRSSDAELGIYNDANSRWNTATNGNDCLSRAFIFTFLCSDGTPFTDKANYSATEFKNEFAGRDLRLAQIVRSPSYTMLKNNNAVNEAPGIVGGIAPTGYQVIKYVLDDYKYNGVSKNINSIPIMRYAEALLNFAEAKAELGTMTSNDWNNTIGLLRSRAGVVNKGIPSTLDPYMKEVLYPQVTDPIIMEVRRERAVELCMEGFRENDLRRWKEGHLFEDFPWWGIYIPELDKPYNVDGRGSADCYFSTKDASDIPADSKNIYVQVRPEGSVEEGLTLISDPSGKGYYTKYNLANTRIWYPDDRQYLNPISAQEIRNYEARGYHLTQNPNW